MILSRKIQGFDYGARLLGLAKSVHYFINLSPISPTFLLSFLFYLILPVQYLLPYDCIFWPQLLRKKTKAIFAFAVLTLHTCISLQFICTFYSFHFVSQVKRKKIGVGESGLRPCRDWCAFVVNVVVTRQKMECVEWPGTSLWGIIHRKETSASWRPGNLPWFVRIDKQLCWFTSANSNCVQNEMQTLNFNVCNVYLVELESKAYSFIMCTAQQCCAFLTAFLLYIFYYYGVLGNTTLTAVRTLSENVTPRFCNNFSTTQSHYAREMSSDSTGIKFGTSASEIRRQNWKFFMICSQQQNRSFHVVERRKTSAKCPKIKKMRVLSK